MGVFFSGQAGAQLLSFSSSAFYHPDQDVQRLTIPRLHKGERSRQLLFLACGSPARCTGDQRKQRETTSKRLRLLRVWQCPILISTGPQDSCIEGHFSQGE